MPDHVVIWPRGQPRTVAWTQTVVWMLQTVKLQLADITHLCGMLPAVGSSMQAILNLWRYCWLHSVIRVRGCARSLSQIIAAHRMCTRVLLGECSVDVVFKCIFWWLQVQCWCHLQVHLLMPLQVQCWCHLQVHLLMPLQVQCWCHLEMAI